MLACSKCGASLGHNARFCRSCGQPAESTTSVAAGAVSPALPNRSAVSNQVFGPASAVNGATLVAPPPPPPAPPPFAVGAFQPVGPPLPPAAQAVWTPPAPSRVPSFPSPPPLASGPPRAARRGQAGGVPKASSASLSGLPAAPEPWEFQKKTAAMADSVLSSFIKPGAARGKVSRVFERMVRGCLLDQQSARAAAEDESGTSEAWIALVVVFAVGVLGPYLVFFTLPSLSQLLMIAVTLGIQVVSFAAGTALMSSILPSVAGVRLTFGQVFRALAYAQSVGALGIITALATVFGLWRIITSVAAIRAITGCDTGKAVVVLLIGAIGSFAVSMVLSPILMAFLVF